eukprot:gnl/TRDRNA2_/TRDRNA2_93807_c0_seq1.p1 gnl/TRDRNA2_/TRDRNA2_93807_c0~~gnl/TRDRNA2_/TRDRNA2_93807_c0_seq1.p1  ORF type:complete len:280 (-),score=34.85 gnl/TRDRNA2_/TRDRNA2_93807_c0_seq1:81-920(-)
MGNASPCCANGGYGPLTDISNAGRSGTYAPLPGGLQAYVTGQVGSQHAIIVCSDIFGFDTGRHLEHCDTLAARCGCLVVCPDFFRGRAPRLTKTLSGLMKIPAILWRLPRMLKNIKSTTWPQIREDIGSTCLYLREKGVVKVGMLGFCWGSYVVHRTCGESDLAPGFVVCGTCAHPSTNRVPSMNKDELTPNQIMSRILCPQLVLASQGEPEEWKPGGSIEAVVRSLDDNAIKEGSDFQVFEEMQHGFVSRGDPSKDRVLRDADLAMTAIIGFMNKYLS